MTEIEIPDTGRTPARSTQDREQKRGRVVALTVTAAVAVVVAGAVAWWTLASPDVRFAGARGPIGMVAAVDDTTTGSGEQPERFFVLAGDTGGTVTTMLNAGRFPVTLELPEGVGDGWRIHVGPSPTVDNRMLPGGYQLDPTSVTAPFTPITLQPGEQAWASVTVWYPQNCRGVPGGTPLQDQSAWIYGNTVTLQATSLGRSEPVTVPVIPLSIPVNTSAGDFSNCGSFAID